jgi:hypothetical protein
MLAAVLPVMLVTCGARDCCSRRAVETTVAVSNGAVITIKNTTGPMKCLFTNGTKVPSFKRCIGADALITHYTLRHNFCAGKK